MFATGLATNMDHEPSRRSLVTVGGQFDIRLTLLSNQDLTVSAGAAVSAEDGFAPRREAMISLKLLR